MAKLTTNNLKAKMRELAHAGDRESYEKLWKAINWLWNLGLLEDKYNSAAVAEDHRLFESGEADPMCDEGFDYSVLDAILSDE